MTIRDLSQLDATVQVLSDYDDVDYVRAPEQVAQTITIIKHAVNLGGAAIVLLLIGVASMIIANTIKITVFNRRKEISIMKYVGATDWFIRWPFIIEGILIGIIGALLPLILSWPVYSQAVRMLYTSFPMIRNIVTFRLGIDVFSVLIPICLFAGTGIGVIGSVTSMRKYLKV